MENVSNVVVKFLVGPKATTRKREATKA